MRKREFLCVASQVRLKERKKKNIYLLRVTQQKQKIQVVEYNKKIGNSKKIKIKIKNIRNFVTFDVNQLRERDVRYILNFEMTKLYRRFFNSIVFTV